MTLTTNQRTVIVVLTAVLLISLSVAAWAVARWAVVRPSDSRGITVTDGAEVKARPDTAFVSFGVTNKAKTAKDAARANATATAAVVAAIVKTGTVRSDIKTVDYSLEPDMDYDKSPPVVSGYSASNFVRVRTKRLDTIGALMDAAINAGANNVQNINFDVEDKKALRKRALALAVKKAEGKAQAIAEALGAKLGEARSASESVEMYESRSRNIAFKTDARQSSSPTPIEPGETTVSAQVKLVYGIR